MASDTTLATVGLATKTSLSTLLSELRTRFIPSSLSPFNSSTTRLTPSLAPDTLWTSLDRSMQPNPSPPLFAIFVVLVRPVRGALPLAIIIDLRSCTYYYFFSLLQRFGKAEIGHNQTRQTAKPFRKRGGRRPHFKKKNLFSYYEYSRQLLERALCSLELSESKVIIHQQPAGVERAIDTTHRRTDVIMILAIPT